MSPIFRLNKHPSSNHLSVFLHGSSIVTSLLKRAKIKEFLCICPLSFSFCLSSFLSQHLSSQHLSSSIVADCLIADILPLVDDLCLSKIIKTEACKCHSGYPIFTVMIKRYCAHCVHMKRSKSPSFTSVMSPSSQSLLIKAEVLCCKHSGINMLLHVDERFFEFGEQDERSLFPFLLVFWIL